MANYILLSVVIVQLIIILCMDTRVESFRPCDGCNYRDIIREERLRRIGVDTGVVFNPFVWPLDPNQGCPFSHATTPDHVPPQ